MSHYGCQDCLCLKHQSGDPHHHGRYRPCDCDSHYPPCPSSPEESECPTESHEEALVDALRENTVALARLTEKLDELYGPVGPEA